MSRNGPVALVFHTLFVVFMVAPIVVVCWVAFTPEGFLSIPTTNFSLRWFKALANYPEFVHAFAVSLWLGALSSCVALLFAVPAALALSRYQFRGRDALSALFLSPLMIPHVVLGIAFLRFFTSAGIGGTFLALVIAHVVVVFPFALRLTLAAATGMDRSVEMAAISLGADGWTMFRRVTLPAILPGIVSGWMLAFTLSLDDLVIASFTTGPGSATLPIRIYSEVRLGVKPEINAICTLVIGLIAVVIVVASLASKLSSDRGESAAPL